MTAENPNRWMAQLVGGRTIQILDPISWAGKPVPERRWIVPGLIPSGSVTLLSGHGGLGKSLISQQLLTSVATGLPWLGRPVETAKALGCYAEDDAEELQRRQDAINRAYGLEFGDLEKLRLASLVGTDCALVKHDGQYDEGRETGLYNELLQICRGEGVQLVVIDSLHDFFAGNENVRPHARRFIGALRHLARMIDGAVLLNAHPSRSGLESGSGEAGSTAWHNSVRSRLYLSVPQEAEERSTVRTLSTKKSNYGPLEETIVLRWEDGVFVAETKPTGALKAAADARADQVFLRCLDAATAQGRNVSHARSGQNYAPRLFATMREAERLPKAALESAMERLFATGQIQVGDTTIPGADRKPKKGIVRTKGGTE